MRVRTVAPAKINWTLEVLGRRDDGYHEIRSVMQTIDLCDEVSVDEGGRRKEEEGGVRAGSATLVAEGEHEATEDDLTLRAVRALKEATGRELPVAVSLVKRIPASVGLGGGSSDAAAVLRCVNRLHGLGLSMEELAAIGAGIGSDVPFFICGGTALVQGRGERVTPLPDAAEAYIVLLAPPVAPVAKTRRMYEALSEDDFGGGRRTEALAKGITTGGTIEEGVLFNSFERAAGDTLEGFARHREALLRAGARVVHLAGSGPGLFARTDSEAAARRVAERVQAPGAKVFVARTLSAQEATALSD